MTYYESAENITITQARAKLEICKVHGLSESDWKEFIADKGDKPSYNAQSVLRWLGY